MKGIKLFASKAAQRAVARSVWRSEREENALPQLCKDDTPCYLPECAEHGCMRPNDE
jgi:hypothetical protein